MKIKKLIISTALLSVLSSPVYAQQSSQTESTKESASMKAPTAKQVPHSFTHHGITINDPWNWLKDQSYPKVDDEDVLAYLNEENAFFEEHMKSQQPLVDTLFAEMKARIKEDESSVPQKDGDYIYWSKFDEGDQYRKHYRKALDADAAEVLMLDENALADGKEYFRLSALSVSPDGNLMAYAYDDDGSERFEIHVRDLRTGQDLPDVIPGILSSIVWAADSGGFVYGLANENWRTDNMQYHRLGDDPSKPTEIFREKNEGYSVGVGLSAQEDWIIIGTGDNVTSEIYMVPASAPTAKPILVKAAKEGVQYSVDVRDEQIYILTNDDHVNFRLAVADLETPDEWRTIISGSKKTYLTGVELYKDFFVTESRVDGLDQITVRNYGGGNAKQIKFPEASYDASIGNNPEYDIEKLRISYESMITPDTVFDYDIASGDLETLKVQEIPSGYDANDYATERLMITARDGAKVPVSIVYKKGFKPDGSSPLHLYAYGAYGYAIPPGFSTTRFSLVDRGFAYAIAHIRGGDDLGYQWYLDGKLKKRTNTFNDFVDVGKGLIERGYTSAGKLTASGGSAGGELMGAVANQSPEIFGAIVAHVPFVDVLNTMLDDTLPLTPGEWPEWGNPITSKEDFEYIRGYSPYDQVEAKAYPPMLYTGGLNDPRVTYWEPAKMVAKLRHMKTDDNLLLMKINMGAGHGGKSGRWNSIYEVAEEQAFILWQLGMAE